LQIQHLLLCLHQNQRLLGRKGKGETKVKTTSLSKLETTLNDTTWCQSSHIGMETAREVGYKRDRDYERGWDKKSKPTPSGIISSCRGTKRDGGGSEAEGGRMLMSNVKQCPMTLF
jgi:hypothetical protein